MTSVCLPYLKKTFFDIFTANPSHISGTLISLVNSGIMIHMVTLLTIIEEDKKSRELPKMNKKNYLV